jgi:phage terminase small subunit
LTGKRKPTRSRKTKIGAKKTEKSRSTVPPTPKYDSPITEGLNKRQKRFIQEYCLDFNATRAAKKAGYSEHTACTQGNRLLRNVHIQAAVTARLEEIGTRIDIQEDRIIAELAKIAFSTIEEYVDKETGELDFKKAVEDGADLSIIQDLTTYQTKDGRVGYRAKLYSKDKAIEMLARIKSMFRDRVVHEGNVNVMTVDPRSLTEVQLKKIKAIQLAVAKGNGHGGNGHR